jgi:carboxylate-amine ligase
MLRENKWRTIRHGLDASIITDTSGNTRLLRDDIELLLEEVAPLAARLGYEQHVETLRDVLARGNSSARQRAVYARRGSLEDVVRFNVREFCEGRPIW